MEEKKDEINQPDLTNIQKLRDSFKDLLNSVKDTLECAKTVVKHKSEDLKESVNEFIDKHREGIEKIKGKAAKAVAVSIIIVSIAASFGKNVTEVKNYIENPDPSVSMTDILIDGSGDTQDLVNVLAKFKGIKSEEDERDEILASESVQIKYGDFPSNDYSYVIVDGKSYIITKEELSQIRDNVEIENAIDEKNIEESNKDFDIER